jgi:predicted site-specific integrase-resolvase
MSLVGINTIMSDESYMSTKKTKEKLGVHIQTLYNWEKAGKIDTIRTAGGQRLYNVNKYLKTYANEDYEPSDENETEIINQSNIQEKINICYVRVSTLNQKDDLERQKKYMKDKYPTYELIEDIGSGINFNRKGLRKIIKLAISGKVNRVVVAFKDRLTRFGYELIEDLIKEYSDGEVVIDANEGIKKDPKEELVEDVLQILNVFTAKMNGLRKYKKIKKIESK